MKKNIAFLFALIFPLFFFNACSSSDPSPEPGPEPEQTIATTNFVLNKPHQWNISTQSETFLVINDKTEMEKYLVKIQARATYGVPTPVEAPDFEKYTLIIASGPTPNGVEKTETKLIRHDAINYTFTIDVSTIAGTAAEGYLVAVTVPRLANNEKIVKNAIIK